MSLPGSTVCEPARNQPRHIACVHPQNLKRPVRAAQCGSTTLGGRPAPRKHPRHDLKRPWQAVAKRAKLESLRIHDLRHTHERRRAGARLGLPIIGKLLGHAQASTTARARCRHGQHLRGWTYYFASRRSLSNALVCYASKLSSDRFVRNQWSKLRINLAASDKQGRPDEALHGDAQSGMVKNLLTIPT
jgi:hypothetical protein